jgi:hypothetical protein
MKYSLRTNKLCQLLISIAIVLCSTGVVAQSSSPAEAAKEARERTGGKVLKVKDSDKGNYRVKVLMPGGQVKTIKVKKKKK